MVLVENETEVFANKDRLNDVIAFIKQALDTQNISSQIQTDLTTAANEIFINIASYAYTSCRETVVIRLKVEKNPNLISINFIDHGVKFNPLERLESDTSMPAGDSGMGIYLANKSLDDLKYRYVNGENHLLLQKQY